MMERRWDGGGDGMFGGTPAFRSPTLDRSTAPPGDVQKKSKNRFSWFRYEFAQIKIKIYWLLLFAN